MSAGRLSRRARFRWHTCPVVAGSPRCSDAHPAAGREPESPMHGKHRRSQTRRAPRSRLTRKQGPSAVSSERDLTAPGRSGIGAWRSATSALWVNLDAMRGKGLAWLGIPAGDYAAGPVLRRDPGPGSCLRCGEHCGTYRRERQDPAIRPRPPLLRVLPQPRRQHRPAARDGRLGSGEAERPAAAPGYSAGRSQTAPGPGSPSGCPTGTSTAWAPAWRSWQAGRLWSNALDMRRSVYSRREQAVHSYAVWPTA